MKRGSYVFFVLSVCIISLTSVIYHDDCDSMRKVSNLDKERSLAVDVRLTNKPVRQRETMMKELYGCVLLLRLLKSSDVGEHDAGDMGVIGGGHQVICSNLQYLNIVTILRRHLYFIFLCRASPVVHLRPSSITLTHTNIFLITSHPSSISSKASFRFPPVLDRRQCEIHLHSFSSILFFYITHRIVCNSTDYIGVICDTSKSYPTHELHEHGHSFEWKYTSIYRQPLQLVSACAGKQFINGSYANGLYECSL